MVKPLRSDDPTPPDVRFRDFGVMDTGARSKAATITSLVINISLAVIVVILGAVVKTHPHIAETITKVALPPEPPPEPKPIIKPPPPPKVLPRPPKIETPKIEPPKPLPTPPKPIPVPPEIKPLPVPVPKPVVTPPAPKAAPAPPAPKVINLAQPKAASAVNNDPHPTPIRLGSTTNPINNTTGPAVSNVNLGHSGAPGMPSSNTGLGPAAKAVTLGSGASNGTNLNGTSRAPVAVTGLNNGVRGGTGTGTRGPVQVGLAPTAAPPVQTALARPTTPTVASPPKVTYKPTPAYTEEARSMHLEGNVSIRIRVTAAGTVEVLGVVHGLGHGLDQSATQAIQSTRFTPAKDSTGRPIDWEGVVNVNFQLS